MAGVMVTPLRARDPAHVVRNKAKNPVSNMNKATLFFFIGNPRGEERAEPVVLIDLNYLRKTGELSQQILVKDFPSYLAERFEQTVILFAAAHGDAEKVGTHMVEGMAIPNEDPMGDQFFP